MGEQTAEVQAQSPPPQQAPTFTYTADPSTASFAVSPPVFLSKDPSFQFGYLTNNTNDTTSPPPPLKPFAYLATGALVFNTTLNPRTPLVLIIRRSPTDSWPLHWETPGGGCDSTDLSILDSVARELWEEAGLVARHISGPVGHPHFFVSSSGNKICKVSFIVDVREGEVRLDPREHVEWMWVGEEEVRRGRVEKDRGEKEIVFTTSEQRDMLLEGFEAFRRSRLEKASGLEGV